ncbi:MAG: beta-lactamase family protein [Actinomycetia bacterium]|nr:beta-lactamase family protein [Actinomycetes bacterium]
MEPGVNVDDLTSLISADIAELAEQFAVPGVAFGADLGGDTIGVNQGITHIDHPLPVDGDTLFQIASMSKPFTATLLMGLVEDGSVSLDDPVITHVPDLAVPNHHDAQDITIGQLLTHTTGWDGDHLLVHPIPQGELADVPAALSDLCQLVPPGTEWTYGNVSYALAGRVIENLTDKPYVEVLRSRILEPLDMAHTAVDADEAILHRVAMRHVSAGGEVSPLYDGAGWQPGWALSPIDLPVGGMISTVNDLLRWLRCWLDRGTEDGLPLSRSTRSTMCTDHVPRYNPTMGQGIGWAIRVHPGATVFGHGGLTAGYCSYSMFCPELDLAAVILTNSTSGTALCSGVAERLIGHVSGQPWVNPSPMSTPDTSAITGRYTGAFGNITVTVDGAELELRTDRHPVSPGEWQPPPEPSRRAVMYASRHGVVTAPANMVGSLIDFAPIRDRGDQAAWIRSGGRIHTRLIS